MTRFISGHDIRQFFDITGYEIDKLRESLKGTPHLKKDGFYYFFDLDYLTGKFKAKEQTPKHLIVEL